ncbi:hypothetical protein JTB14_005494 [Gonioctena quinquepunctata]|nr:hypothetical protein JTB14_005494 [Gonioctena quinquepunctata]
MYEEPLKLEIKNLEDVLLGADYRRLKWNVWRWERIIMNEVLRVPRDLLKWNVLWSTTTFLDTHGNRISNIKMQTQYPMTISSRAPPMYLDKTLGNNKKQRIWDYKETTIGGTSHLEARQEDMQQEKAGQKDFQNKANKEQPQSEPNKARAHGISTPPQLPDIRRKRKKRKLAPPLQNHTVQIMSYAKPAIERAILSKN